jgi:uncharacterized protein (DUF1800 family)
MGEQGNRVGRRGLLGAAAAGTALAAVPAVSAAAAPAKRHRHRKHVPVTVPADHALHALRRLGYGPTPESLAAVRKVGVSRWLDDQLAPSASDLHETLVETMFPFLTRSAKLIADTHSGDVQTTVAAYEWATLHRAMYSEQQVRARLTEVWLDHFNVCTLTEKSFMPWVRFSYDFQVIRPRATGKFSELLKAVLLSPAMLTYLDQWISTKEYPVENLARESLELHTVGIGNYTEYDVKAYSRLLTGCTIDGAWNYRYNPALHSTGPLKILGWRAPNHSPDGEHLVGQFADYLAHRPATARNVARRLLTHFVTDHPSKHLVERVAHHYLRHHTDIGSTLKFIVEQPEFFASRGKKTRRPGDTFVAAVRGLGMTWTALPELGVPTSVLVQSWSPFMSLLRDAGHVPGEWSEPDGYPQVGAPWLNSNTTLQVWRLMAALIDANNTQPFFKGLGPAAEAWRPGITYDGLIAAAAQRITGQQIHPVHRRVIAELADVEPQEKPNLGWRLAPSAAHRAIEFGILASEYMVLR